MAKLTIEIPADVLKALQVMAYTDGTTPEAILQTFAGDLTGIARRGSDEEDMAREYYERGLEWSHWVLRDGPDGPGTFAQHILREYCLEELRNVAMLQREIRDNQEELEYYEQHPEEEEDCTPALLEELRAEIKYNQERITELWIEYQEHGGAADLDEALETVREALASIDGEKERGKEG